MKTLKFVLLVTATTFAFDLSAQQESKECLEFKMIASDSKMMKDYQEAAIYYWKIEKNCQADDKIYANLRFCYENLINETTDEAKKKAYRDTLITVYEKQEAKYGKEPSWSLWQWPLFVSDHYLKH